MVSQRLGADGRGQTLQDYVLAVGVFIIIVAFVLSYVPTFFSPYTSPIQSDQTAQSDRVAFQVASDLKTSDSATQLNASRATEFFSPAAGPTDGDDLRARYGLASTTRVNVTLHTIESLPDPTVGDRYRDRAVAASAHVFTDGGNVCQPTCRLVVRVW
jgi:hypothetical protein